MFDLSPIKLVLIVAVILVVMGPDKLPEVSRQMGSAWRTLRTWQQKVESEIREAVPDLPSSAEIVRFARSPVNLLNSLADRVMEPSEIDATTPESSEPAGETTTEPSDPGVADEETSATPERPSFDQPVLRPSLTLPADPSLN